MAAPAEANRLPVVIVLGVVLVTLNSLLLLGSLYAWFTAAGGETMTAGRLALFLFTTLTAVFVLLLGIGLLNRTRWAFFGSKIWLGVNILVIPAVLWFAGETPARVVLAAMWIVCVLFAIALSMLPAEQAYRPRKRVVSR